MTIYIIQIFRSIIFNEQVLRNLLSDARQIDLYEQKSKDCHPFSVDYLCSARFAECSNSSTYGKHPGLGQLTINRGFS